MGFVVLHMTLDGNLPVINGCVVSSLELCSKELYSCRWPYSMKFQQGWIYFLVVQNHHKMTTANVTQYTHTQGRLLHRYECCDGEIFRIFFTMYIFRFCMQCANYTYNYYYLSSVLIEYIGIARLPSVFPDSSEYYSGEMEAAWHDSSELKKKKIKERARRPIILRT